MLQNADVRRTMLGVELLLSKSLRPNVAHSTLFLDGTDPEVFGASSLRRGATIVTEFHSGSDRPGIGPAVRFAKRMVRRGLRWYVPRMIDQQSRFNHRLVDVIEQMTVRYERLSAEVARLEQVVQDQNEEIDRLTSRNETV
jgi:hypothetical protein